MPCASPPTSPTNATMAQLPRPQRAPTPSAASSSGRAFGRASEDKRLAPASLESQSPMRADGAEAGDGSLKRFEFKFIYII